MIYYFKKSFVRNTFLNVTAIWVSYSNVLQEIIIEPRHEKTNVVVSNPVRHKPGCTVTEDGKKLEISDL